MFGEYSTGWSGRTAKGAKDEFTTEGTEDTEQDENAPTQGWIAWPNTLRWGTDPSLCSG